jgi:hypothetical protein
MLNVSSSHFDPHVWSGRASQENFVELAVAVLHQCIRPLIGAFCAPGHHGYQRACDLISGKASTGHSGHQCSHAPGRPTSISSHPLADLGRKSISIWLRHCGLLILSGDLWRRRRITIRPIGLLPHRSSAPQSSDHEQERSRRCEPVYWRAQSQARCGAAASWRPRSRA